MIHTEITDQALLEAIEKKKPGWALAAERKRDEALAVGKVGEGDGIWSQIKEVFVLLQAFKCAYCEFPLPQVATDSAEKMAVDCDIEHFRPKNRVTPWPTSEVVKNRPGIDSYRTGVFAGSPEGYVRLAFEPLNYIISCKVCNSSFKADRFPIAGQPDAESKEKVTLDKNEKPLLLFPFGENGDDPEDYFTFRGPMVLAQATSGPEGLRAQVTIDFFELDTRAGLIEGRCWAILFLWPQLVDRDSSDLLTSTRARDFLRTYQEGHRQLHTACGRAFIELYDRDRPRARAFYDAATQYLSSKDPAVFKALI